MSVNDHFIDGMPNDEYHKPETGFSTSTLKEFNKDPALVKWRNDSPQDKSKMAAIDFGTDFHSYFLEPEEFKKQYQVLPEFNRRKKEEKEEEQELINQWQEDGIIAVKAEDMVKLEAMRQSAMAHPTVKSIMDLNGVAERSYFWTDQKTGVLCKCRPDFIAEFSDKVKPAFVPNHCNLLVADVKTIADISRVETQIENLKYYVQDPFYTRGIEQVEGGKVCFVFIFVSTSLSLGRYPVQVVMLADTAKYDGKEEVNEALAKYAKFSTSQDDSIWQTVITLDRPSWAMKDEEML